jgi:hypothetical protein
MRALSRQFGNPGLLGRLVGRGMARRNADFNHAVAALLDGSGFHDVRHTLQEAETGGGGRLVTGRA